MIQPPKEKSTIYSFEGHDYDLKITYGHAIFTLEPEFGIDLTEIFGEKLEEFVSQMYLNDSLPLRLWWWHLKQRLGDTHEAHKEALEKLTPSSLQRFKDAWWNAVVVFIGPQRGELLEQILKEIPDLTKKEMTKRLKELRSDDGSLSTEPKQESS